MRRITVLMLSVCMLLSGCGIRIMPPGERTDEGVFADGFDGRTTYYDHYSSEKNENICKVKGTIHQSADDRNGVITSVMGESGGGSVTVTGSMDCIEGSIRLLYVAADGTETIIAEGTERTVEAEVNVAEGEGTIEFDGAGAGAVCRFQFVLETGEHVSFGDSIEEEADLVGTECTEDFEAMEELDEVEDFESVEELDEVEDFESVAELEETEEMAGFEEIEDNWPESICYKVDGLYAQPLSVAFKVEKPMKLALKCETRDGKLRLKIIGKSGGEERIYYDETNPDGTYSVAIDTAGTCQALFYAEYHIGSVEITPLEE